MAKKLIVTLLAVFAALALAELPLANRESIDMSLRGLEEASLSLAGAETTGSVSLYGDGEISVRGEGTLTLTVPDVDTGYFTLTTNRLVKICNFSTKKRDVSSAYVDVVTGTHRFMPEGDTCFALESNGGLSKIVFNFDSDCFGLNITDITLNRRPALSFNFARWLLACLICGAVAVVILTKAWNIVYKTGDYRRYAVIGAATVVCCICCANYPAFDKYPFEKPINEYDCYAQLFDAFQKGRVDLDIPFDEEAYASLDNPYDYYERSAKLGGTGALWDRAYHDGKLYCYFGAAPVLTVYYPIWLVSGYIPQASMASMFLTLEATAAVILALLAALRHFKIQTQLPLIFGAIVAVCGASLIYVLGAHPSMYYNAMISGILWLALTLRFSWRAADALGSISRRVYLALAAFSAVMTVASRPNMVVFAVMTAPVYVEMLFSRRRTVRDKCLNAVSFFAPLLAGAALIMLYNQARFGSPLDFGNRWQLTLADVSSGSPELYMLFPAIAHYFLQPPQLTGNFPYIAPSRLDLDIYRRWTYTYASVGVFAFPVSLGVFGTPFLEKNREKRFTYFYVLGAALIIAFLDVCLAGVHFRYIADIAFPMMLVGALVLLELAGRPSDCRMRRNAFFAVNGVFAVSFAVSFALIFANEANNLYRYAPHVFMFFNNIFS